MAIDYTDLAQAFGSLVGKINIYDAWIGDISTYQAELIATLSAEDALHLVDDVPDTYEALQDQITSWIFGGLKTQCDNVFQNPTLVTDHLALGDIGGVDEVLVGLRQDMLDTSNTVKACTITIGSPSYDLTNADSVAILTTTTLDGVNAPASGAAANRTYAGVTSELAQDSQTVTMTCTADAESGGTLSGGEGFLIVGNPSNTSYHREDEGFGEVNGTVGNATGTEMIVNGAFEQWSTGNPVSWTIVDGVQAVDFEESVDGLRNSSAFKLLGGNTNVTLQQIIPEDRLERRRQYVMIALVKKDGTSGSIAFTLKEGSTMIANFTATINSLSAGWNLLHDFFVVPDEIESDWIARFDCDTSGCNGDPLIDDFAILPVSYFNGIGYVLVAKDEKIIVGDKISFTVSNDNAGVFQTAVRRLYGIQLPSTGSTPTLPEIYAQGQVVVSAAAALNLSANIGSVTVA